MHLKPEENEVKLLVQPGDNVVPLLEGIRSARKSIQLAIFRSDSEETERALKDAVARGVQVHSLIANRNHNGEDHLRKLELRLLEYGVTVVRTGDDLVRYHDKLMVVDHEKLFLMAFNLRHLDIERSRSFGIVTTNPKLVQEAVRLYEADARRQPYTTKNGRLVVSPLNARQRLAEFIRKSRTELLIYDPKISDRAMLALLNDRKKAGVEIKIIGKVVHNSKGLEVRKLSHLRLHTRSMISDGQSAFLGSQSLRKAELDARREVGIIFRDRRVISRLLKIFRDDWASAEPAPADEKDSSETIHSAAKAVAKTLAEKLPPVEPRVKSALKEIAGVNANGSLERMEVEATVKGAVKEAVAGAVEEVVKEIVREAQSVGHK
jgi:phosphatidylserine/phosphatidylglycerophosphate/cardiolipin synthase-like enzyme